MTPALYRVPPTTTWERVRVAAWHLRCALWWVRVRVQSALGLRRRLSGRLNTWDRPAYPRFKERP